MVDGVNGVADRRRVLQCADPAAGRSQFFRSEVRMRPGSPLVHRVQRLVVAVAAATAIGFVASIAVAAAPPTPGPATGHASVIAQAVLEFADGPHHWAVALTPIPAESESPAPAGIGFVVADEGTVLVSTDDIVTSRLRTGEAALVLDSAGTSMAGEGGGAAAFTVTLLRGELSGSPADVGAVFDAGGGSHDVDLVRDVLAPTEGSTMPSAAGVPILVLAVRGQITVTTAADPAGTALARGEADTFDGDLTVTNTGTESAEFVAVVIGPEVAGAAPPTAVPATAPPTTAVATTTLAPSTTTTTTTAPAVDTDADGLLDGDEALYGTDPANPDTDGDAIDDGAEVYTYGTDPTLEDSDVDGLHDYAEIDVYGTDPTSFDSDGDEIGDGAEIHATGSDPLVADTDGDGLDDGEEGLFGSNPLTADDDGDGLTDPQEQAAGTDPYNADTDGDGTDDGLDPDPLAP
jgi:hypothetical protein